MKVRVGDAVVKDGAFLQLVRDCYVLVGTSLHRTDYSRVAFPKLCSEDPSGSATSSQWIRGYISVMATLEFTCYFN